MKKRCKQTMITFLFAITFAAHFTVAARLFFTPATQTNYAPNCPIALEVFVDTQGAQTIGTEFIIPYDKTKTTVLGFAPTQMYDLPIGLRLYDRHIYYSALNVNGGLFAGFGKLGTLYIKARPGLKEMDISFLVDSYGSGVLLDTNILNAESYDILDKVGAAHISFDQTKECSFDMELLSGLVRYKNHGSLEEGVAYRTEKIDEAREEKKQDKEKIIAGGNDDYTGYIIGMIIGVVLIGLVLLLLLRKGTGDERKRSS